MREITTIISTILIIILSSASLNETVAFENPTSAVVRHRRDSCSNLQIIQSRRKSPLNSNRDDKGIIMFSNKDNNKAFGSNTEPSNSIRILCLHGKGSCGESFQKILSPLQTSLNDWVNKYDGSSSNFEFSYISAPFPMKECNGSNLKREWWTLPQGVRSFNARDYVGFEQSANLIEDAIKENHYDFILGHSQGAILLSSLIAMNKIDSKPMGYVLNGCAWPNPFSKILESGCYCDINSYNETRSLFVIGENDKINPPEGAVRVRDALKNLGLDGDIILHKGGHSIPVNDQIVLDSIIKWMRSRVSESTDNLNSVQQK